MSSLRILPLGGLGEIGMNCLALEQRGEVLLIDCGVTFDGRGLGVDVVHPSFEALAPYRMAGLFVTHGHEDHIGAIPYLLRRFDMPVYGPRYALGLVRQRVGEHEILGHAKFHEVMPRAVQQVGSFEVEPIRVTHSIADATALAIRTDAGLVVHTGDFKFDATPPDGESFDVERLAELADEGVELLFSDSTNIDASGTTGSEQGVGQSLERIIAGAQQAVVVGMFASNVHRLRMLGDIARRHGRKIVVLGRSVATHARVARSTMRATGDGAGRSYLEWPEELVWPAERVGELPRRAVLALATGSQGEAQAALSRIASGEHPSFAVTPGDVVVLSSRVIPGNEPQVMRVAAGLLRRGAQLHSVWSDRSVHVSGHAHRDEQRRMLEMVQPQAFIPVHGTLHHLGRHASLARETGVPDVCVLENGDLAELDDTGLRKIGRAPVGRVHVFGGRAIPDAVLDERIGLAARGVIHVTVPVDASGRVVSDVMFTSRGVLDESRDAHLVQSACAEARRAVDLLVDRSAPEIVDAVRQAVRRTVTRVVGFKPMTLVTVVRVRA